MVDRERERERKRKTSFDEKAFEIHSEGEFVRLLLCLPAKSKSFAVFVRPWSAAFIKGVKPKLFLASILIPLHFVNSMLTISV